jgi:diaphanous 1
MVLINALTNGPESLEERILLREEFSRRGLNEVIVVSVRWSSQSYYPLTVPQTLRYIRPPESLITQLDVYTEEKFEDEEDMRERAANLFQADNRPGASEISSALEELLVLTRSHPDDYGKVVAIIRVLIPLFRRESERYVPRREIVAFLMAIPSRLFKDKSSLHRHHLCRTGWRHRRFVW